MVVLSSDEFDTVTFGEITGFTFVTPSSCIEVKCKSFDASVLKKNDSCAISQNCNLCRSQCIMMLVFQQKCIDVYRVAKTHRIPYLYRSFFAKVTYI